MKFWLSTWILVEYLALSDKFRAVLEIDYKKRH